MNSTLETVEEKVFEEGYDLKVWSIWSGLEHATRRFHNKYCRKEHIRMKSILITYSGDDMHIRIEG